MKIEKMEIIGSSFDKAIDAKYWSDFMKLFEDFIQRVYCDLETGLIQVFIYDEIIAEMPFFLERHELL